MLFSDRADAGRQLAARLVQYRGGDTVIPGIPRGGVPVAAEIARILSAPLDLILVRKLGVLHQPELAFGAIGERGVRVLNGAICRDAALSREAIAAVERHERRELARRVARYRRGRAPLDLTRRVAVVVDDGVATGATARAACRVARALGAARVVLAVPVAAGSSARELAAVADEVVVLHAPESLMAVGQFYEDFTQVPDEEVTALLLGRLATSRNRPDNPNGHRAGIATGTATHVAKP